MADTQNPNTQKPVPASAHAAVKKKRRKKKKGLSKQLKALIIAGSVVVFLLLVLLVLVPILQNLATPEVESSSESSVVSTASYVVNTDANNLKTVTVTNYDDEALSFVYKRIGTDNFDIPLLKGYTLVQDDINTLASYYKRLLATQVVEGGESHPADYGMDTPSLQIDYVFEDDTAPVSVEIGDLVPGSTYYYGRVVGSDTIYVFAQIDYFLKDPVSFVDLKVTDQPSSLFNSSGTWIAEDKFTSIEWTGTGLAAPIECGQEDMSKYSKVVSSAYDYYVTDGKRRSLLNTAIVTELEGTAFFGLTADSVVAIGVTGDALAQYGMDNPYKQLSMTIGGITYTLKCSPIPDESGYYYVMKDGFKAVYRVSGETLTWAEYDYLDVASAIIFAPYIDSTEKVVLDFGDGQKHELTINCPEVSTDLKVTYNGTQDIDPASYRTFFSLIIYSSADDFLTGEEDLTVDPLLTITYTQQDGTVDTIKFIPISARSVAIDYNGICNFYMRSEFIDKITRELNNLINGNTVTATW